MLAKGGVGVAPDHDLVVQWADGLAPSEPSGTSLPRIRTPPLTNQHFEAATAKWDGDPRSGKARQVAMLC